MQDKLLHGVFAITKCISVGKFASPTRMNHLLNHDITHILNVSEAPPVACPISSEFASIVWHPIEDLASISESNVIKCINDMHKMLLEPNSHVYVHCIAGKNRSPTIIWLYLIACGLSQENARRLIEKQSPDSVPGHKKLITQPLVERVLAHGTRYFQPLSRPEILLPEKD